MNWRPPNWGNIYKDAYGSSIDAAPEFAIQAGMQGLAFEAGADAMLEALLKVDTWVQVTRDKRMLVSPAFQVKDWKKYKIVFIPQEE